MVGKAEHLPGRQNPRFVVTFAFGRAVAGGDLYEDLYCARGDMENRIKEQQLALFADRTSTATMRANQLRLWLSGRWPTRFMNQVAAHRTPRHVSRTSAVRHDRVRPVEIRGLIKLSVRRVHVALSSCLPLQALFHQALENIRRAYPLRT